MLKRGFLLVPNEQRTADTQQGRDVPNALKGLRSNKKMFRPGDRAPNGSVGALTVQPRTGTLPAHNNHPAPQAPAIKIEILGLSDQLDRM